MGLRQKFSMCQLAGEPFIGCPDIGISNHDHLPASLNPGVAMVYIFVLLRVLVPLWLFQDFAGDLVASDWPEEESMSAPIVGTE